MKNWKDLFEQGAIGSEHGEVRADEEYNNTCRITLEKCDGHYAITCCIYGTFVHTAFASEDNYQSIYDAMKCDLREFVDDDMTDVEKSEFFDEFAMKY